MHDAEMQAVWLNFEELKLSDDELKKEQVLIGLVIWCQLYLVTNEGLVFLSTDKLSQLLKCNVQVAMSKCSFCTQFWQLVYIPGEKTLLGDPSPQNLFKSSCRSQGLYRVFFHWYPPKK